MNISFLSLYADQLMPFFERGIIDREIKHNIVSVDYVNLREFADPPHFKVDDYPFSNKKGMLLKYDVLMKPGLTIFTLIFSLANSIAKDLVKPSKAVFVDA